MLVIWCRRGITMMEVLITVALLSVISGLAAPWILSTLQAYRLRAAAWELAGDLRLARQKAVSLQQDHRICFSGCSTAVPQGGYLLERLDSVSGLWQMETSRDVLPDGATITSTAQRVIFNSKGETSNWATITLTNEVGTYQLTTAQTGRVQVCKGECS